ncbi:MAG: transcription elongation factor GreA [Candidatus Dojkabacteria bacterium]
MAKTKKNGKTENAEMKLTQDAYNVLQAELDNRIGVLRKEIADEIAAARELGDLSENHAYQVAMEKKEMNENRILEIEDILAIAVIAKESKSDNQVSIGEKVEIQNMDNKEKRTVILVGTEETKAANPLEGKISVDSPIGKALYNALVGEIVEVALPNKKISYKILKLIKAS